MEYKIGDIVQWSGDKSLLKDIQHMRARLVKSHSGTDSMYAEVLEGKMKGKVLIAKCNRFLPATNRNGANSD